MHFKDNNTLYRKGRMMAYISVLLWLITGCINEDFSGCPQGNFHVAFEYVHHTDNTCPDRFDIDVQQIDLYVFDAAGCFLKCITRKGEPFPKDFRIDPELSAGSYTLVAWGNLTDEVTLQPVFITGQTTLEQALLSLNATEERGVNHKLTPVFHAMKQVEINSMEERTEVLSFIKNENHLRLNVKWFEKSGIPCIHRCADGVRVRVVDPKGATYKFDNSVVASGNELTYYPYQGTNNDAWNQLTSIFSLMRLVEGEKLTLLIERLMQDGTIKKLYRSDLLELVRRHPYSRTQSELDREDVYEVEISLIDDLDGNTDTHMQTAITVAGWTIILQDTEM